MNRPAPENRNAYRHFQSIPTRWMDNDVYGHVNNVVYYSYFDTVVNQYLIEQRALNIETGKIIGLVVETQCHYFASIT
ncbi:MAG: acyl-CoA thioesterase, partial [Burkholderiales bacterium]